MSEIPWREPNQYHAGDACEFCEGIVRCEHWCILKCAEVLYAYSLVLYPWKMTTGDEIRLHAMGVTYGLNKCLTDGEDK